MKFMRRIRKNKTLNKILRLLLGIVKWLLFILFTIVLLFLYYKPGRYSIRFGNVYYQFLSEGAGFARYKLDADAKTFKIYMDNPTYGTDKNSAYHFEHKINGSHGPSFILLKGNYQKDKNHVYYRDRIVPHADPKTFIGPLIEDENSSTPRSYAEDRYDFYHEGLPIHVYDKETFRQIYYGSGKLWGIDSKYYYYGHHRQQINDPKSFKILDYGLYAKDKYTVYFKNEIVDGADPATFHVTSLVDGADKYGIYRWGVFHEPSDTILVK